jgi:hypothetical protein
VKDLYGIVWEARVRIAKATSPPAQNAYWTMIRTEAVAAAPMIETGQFAKISGLSPSNTPEQNSNAVEAFFKAIPEGTSLPIYVPSGEYHFARTMLIYRRPVHLFGDNGTIFGNGTKFFFHNVIDAVLVDRGNSSFQETIIERICLIGINSGYGFAARGRIKLRDCTAKGFKNNGFQIWGNLEEGGDVSGSFLQSCHSLENGGDGFFIGRVDGNAVTVMNCDARDNGGRGFNDDSFLGNFFFSNMAHYNKGGDFFVRDWGNARSTFVACYSEGNGAIFSQLGPYSTVIGGIWGAGYKIGATPELRRGSYIPLLNQ